MGVTQLSFLPASHMQVQSQHPSPPPMPTLHFPLSQKFRSQGVEGSRASGKKSSQVGGAFLCGDNHMGSLPQREALNLLGP